jgi:hypothetical protein
MTMTVTILSDDCERDSAAREQPDHPIEGHSERYRSASAARLARSWVREREACASLTSAMTWDR